jgi:hypothetical protein
MFEGFENTARTCSVSVMVLQNGHAHPCTAALPERWSAMLDYTPAEIVPKCWGRFVMMLPLPWSILRKV